MTNGVSKDASAENEKAKRDELEDLIAQSVPQPLLQLADRPWLVARRLEIRYQFQEHPSDDSSRDSFPIPAHLGIRGRACHTPGALC